MQSSSIAIRQYTNHRIPKENTAAGAHGLQPDRAPVETGRSRRIRRFGEFVDRLTIHLDRYLLTFDLDVIGEPFVVTMRGGLYLACSNQAAGLALTGPARVDLSFVTECRASLFFIASMEIDSGSRTGIRIDINLEFKILEITAVYRPHVEQVALWTLDDNGI